MDTSDQITCLDQYFASFEDSLASKNYKPWTLKNYRYLLRRFGRLLEAEGIAQSALTPDLAVELGRRLPTTPKSQIKIPNLAKQFVQHLIDLGVATRPPLTAAQAERGELLAGFETYLVRQRGLSQRSIYHVLRFADRFLDHRFGDNMLDLPALNTRDVVAFMEHLLRRKRPLPRHDAGHASAQLLPIFVRTGAHDDQLRALRTPDAQALGCTSSTLPVTRRGGGCSGIGVG